MDASAHKIKLFALIQKQAGVSRRKAQELISANEVEINGTPRSDPYQWVDPSDVAQLTLRGHSLSLHPPERRVYRFHKPDGMLCSHDDPHEGNTVGRVLRAEGFMGYSWAGRLDRDAEGLLLVTNDGELLNHLSHPRYEIEKIYHVWTTRFPEPPRLKAVLRGMEAGILDDGDRLKAVSARLEGKPPHLRLVLTEGKKHEIKRLCRYFDLQITRLRRVAVGTCTLGSLKPGAFDRLGETETSELRALVSRSDAPQRSAS